MLLRFSRCPPTIFCGYAIIVQRISDEGGNERNESTAAMTKRVIYGESNDATIVAKDGYFVDQLTLHNQISYDDVFLLEKFDMSQFFQPSFFPISFFYLGMLTKEDDFHLCLPNLTMRQMFVEYFLPSRNVEL